MAIVGIACRFPGDVKNLDQFWSVLQGGVETVAAIPAERFDVTSFVDEVRGVPAKTTASRAGTLRGMRMPVAMLPSGELLIPEPDEDTGGTVVAIYRVERGS